MSSIKFTDQAIIAIRNSMQRSNLDLDKFAFYLYIYEGNLSVTFTDELKGAKKKGTILIKIDDVIEHHHKASPLVVDYVTNGVKQGIIFLEEKEYERRNN